MESEWEDVPPGRIGSKSAHCTVHKSYGCTHDYRMSALGFQSHGVTHLFSTLTPQPAQALVLACNHLLFSSSSLHFITILSKFPLPLLASIRFRPSLPSG